ncbi:MAG: hypothetical protein JXA82_13150 [Sedimentisphaerales bacterium]|nr:hypothetical protein [Sedimentisphaerales bacterium]
MNTRNHQFEAGVKALVGLLHAFQAGRILDPSLERKEYEQHTAELSQDWNQHFPGFPDGYFPYASIRGLLYRGRRDAYLKSIIVRLVHAADSGQNTIVNPACVFGRHARDLARRLPGCKVIGTDIDPKWNWFYEKVLRKDNPANFEFVRDNIFVPRLNVQPTAVVFFGACGSVSDGAMDFAIKTGSRYLICRTCCHACTGGNWEILKRADYVNRFFRLYYRFIAARRRKEKYAGFYFSDQYAKEHYPRSAAVKQISDSETFLKVCRNSVNSDICRAIIDLDRYLYLLERGYRVWYRGELFVAERNSG